MKGKHAAPRRRKKKNPSGGDTREFVFPQKHTRAGLFFFTFVTCLLLAAAAAAVLAVDYGGRAMNVGAEPTAAFAVSEAGEAHLSFLGRDYRADVSFLLAADSFLTRTAGYLSRRVPASLRLAVKELPVLYDKTEKTAKAVFARFSP